MLPTESSAERRLYEGFLAQLPDDYVVYHSVAWVFAPDELEGRTIEGECDFLIAHPEDGLLILEAKAGGVSYDRASRAWRQFGRGSGHALEDPFRQARQEMDSLVEILEHQPDWSLWRPSYGYGVAFPDAIFDQDAYAEARADWAIDRDDMGRLAQRVKEIMASWRHPNRHFGQAGMEALQAALGIRVEVRTPLQLEFGEGDRRIVELTHNQTYVLSYLRRLHRAAIVGPAGSGKTLLATELAKRLARGGTETLLTCFSKRLAQHLRESAGEVRHLHVHHFHDLCLTLAERAGIPIPPPPEEPTEASSYLDVALPELLPKAATVLGPQFEAMVVDEAQDFLPSWWPNLMTLHSHSEDGFLFLFADSNQNIDGGTRPEDLVDMSFPLPVNMRNTEPIHEFVSVFYQGEQPAEGRGRSGAPVEIISYQRDEELVPLLVNVLQNLEDEGIPLKDLVLLTPDPAGNSALGHLQQLNGYRLSEEPQPGTLLTSSVAGFKGLERPVVILAEVAGGEREDLATQLYLGGSRARNHLIVIAAEPVARELRVLAGVSAP
jgi:hypothetical protein